VEARKVVAVTVNWNRAEDTLECVRSLKRQSQALNKIIVIDNGSDKEPSFVSLNPYEDVEVIETGTNLGFGAGANLGIKRALTLGADYVLVINNDTVADSQMMARLVEGSQTNSFEISAPLIYYYEPSDQVWSSGGNICPLIGLPLDAHNRKSPPTIATRRSFLTGCCLLFSRKAIEQVGMFDEGFFMYYEDLDLMARASVANLSMGVIPSAKLWHKEAQSSGGYLNPRERYWSARSLMRYSKRATRWWNAIPLWLHRVISMGLWTLRLAFKGKPEALKAYWQGIWDGLCNKNNKLD
jgi:hypothetical protein